MKIINEEVYDGFTKVNTEIMNIFQFAKKFNIAGGFKNFKDEKRVVFEFITKKYGNELPTSKLTLNIDEKNKSITTIIDGNYKMWADTIENNLSNMFIDGLCKFKDHNYEDAILIKMLSDLMEESVNDPSNRETLGEIYIFITETISAHRFKNNSKMLDFSQIFLLLFNPLMAKQLVIDISLIKGTAGFTVYSYKNIPYTVSVSLI
jgi:hypothetical protein